MKKPTYKYPNFVSKVELKSENGKRYWLNLKIDENKTDGITVILKNPSRADKNISDKNFSDKYFSDKHFSDKNIEYITLVLVGYPPPSRAILIDVLDLLILILVKFREVLVLNFADRDDLRDLFCVGQFENLELILVG